MFQRPRAVMLSPVLLAALVILVIATAAETLAQEGATMTVLRGEVAVVHPDGSAIQPAPSGTDVFPGDEIRTVGPAGALITFFSGTEIEMGADTSIAVQKVSRQGDQVEVSL